MAVEINVPNKERNRWVWLSEVKMVIDQVFMDSENLGRSQVARMAGKTVVEAMETCADEKNPEVFRSTVSLINRLVVGDVFDDKLVAGKI